MSPASDHNLRILESYQDMQMVEQLMLVVWPGSQIDVVPAHLLLTIASNGGVVIGSFDGDKLVGFVFGFLGFPSRSGRPALKHCSHELGVHPDYENRGLGYKLKRAQWQLVRQQGIDLVTWTYDPLLSRNAYLNIAKLGAVCSSYKHEVYGQMRDELNLGLPSDRFQIDWWVNTARVSQRLSKTPRHRLDLAHLINGGAQYYNRTRLNKAGYPLPFEELFSLPEVSSDAPSLLIVEIPADFQTLKAADMQLALSWRMHSRQVFEDLFDYGYIITDFVYLPGKHPRSYYALSRGDHTLGE